MYSVLGSQVCWMQVEKNFNKATQVLQLKDETKLPDTSSKYCFIRLALNNLHNMVLDAKGNFDVYSVVKEKNS